MTQPALPSCMRLLCLLALPLALAGCNHRVAAQKTIDLCAAASEPVATFLGETPAYKSGGHGEVAGECEFSVGGDNEDGRRVRMWVSTEASSAPEDLARTARLLMAEAEQATGAAGSDRFADVASLSVVFGQPSDSRQQVLIGERGVLMEINLVGNTAEPEQVATLVHEVWARVLAYEPAKE